MRKLIIIFVCIFMFENANTKVFKGNKVVEYLIDSLGRVLSSINKDFRKLTPQNMYPLAIANNQLLWLLNDLPNNSTFYSKLLPLYRESAKLIAKSWPNLDTDEYEDYYIDQPVQKVEISASNSIKYDPATVSAYAELARPWVYRFTKKLINDVIFESPSQKLTTTRLFRYVQKLDKPAILDCIHALVMNRDRDFDRKGRTGNKFDCDVSPRCEELIYKNDRLRRNRKGETAAHEHISRILFLQIFKTLRCGPSLKTKIIIRDICNKIHYDLVLLMMSDKYNLHQHDFLEHVLYCSLEGYSVFSNETIINRILNWQTKDGCFQRSSNRFYEELRNYPTDVSKGAFFEEGLVPGDMVVLKELPRFTDKRQTLPKYVYTVISSHSSIEKFPNDPLQFQLIRRIFNGKKMVSIPVKKRAIPTWSNLGFRISNSTIFDFFDHIRDPVVKMYERQFRIKSDLEPSKKSRSKRAVSLGKLSNYHGISISGKTSYYTSSTVTSRLLKTQRNRRSFQESSSRSLEMMTKNFEALKNSHSKLGKFKGSVSSKLQLGGEKTISSSVESLQKSSFSTTRWRTIRNVKKYQTTALSRLESRDFPISTRKPSYFNASKTELKVVNFTIQNHFQTHFNDVKTQVPPPSIPLSAQMSVSLISKIKSHTKEYQKPTVKPVGFKIVSNLPTKKSLSFTNLKIQQLSESPLSSKNSSPVGSNLEVSQLSKLASTEMTVFNPRSKLWTKTQMELNSDWNLSSNSKSAPEKNLAVVTENSKRLAIKGKWNLKGQENLFSLQKPLTPPINAKINKINSIFTTENTFETHSPGLESRLPVASLKNLSVSIIKLKNNQILKKTENFVIRTTFPTLSLNSRVVQQKRGSETLPEITPFSNSDSELFSYLNPRQVTKLAFRKTTNFRSNFGQLYSKNATELEKSSTLSTPTKLPNLNLTSRKLDSKFSRNKVNLNQSRTMRSRDLGSRKLPQNVTQATSLAAPLQLLESKFSKNKPTLTQTSSGHQPNPTTISLRKIATEGMTLMIPREFPSFNLKSQIESKQNFNSISKSKSATLERSVNLNYPKNPYFTQDWDSKFEVNIPSLEQFRKISPRVIDSKITSNGTTEQVDLKSTTLSGSKISTSLTSNINLNTMLSSQMKDQHLRLESNFMKTKTNVSQSKPSFGGNFKTFIKTSSSMYPKLELKSLTESIVSNLGSRYLKTSSIRPKTIFLRGNDSSKTQNFVTKSITLYPAVQTTFSRKVRNLQNLTINGTSSSLTKFDLISKNLEVSSTRPQNITLRSNSRSTPRSFVTKSISFPSVVQRTSSRQVQNLKNLNITSTSTKLYDLNHPIHSNPSKPQDIKASKPSLKILPTTKSKILNISKFTTESQKSNPSPIIENPKTTSTFINKTFSELKFPKSSNSKDLFEKVVAEITKPIIVEDRYSFPSTKIQNLNSELMSTTSKMSQKRTNYNIASRVKSETSTTLTPPRRLDSSLLRKQSLMSIFGVPKFKPTILDFEDQTTSAKPSLLKNNEIFPRVMFTNQTAQDQEPDDTTTATSTGTTWYYQIKPRVKTTVKFVETTTEEKIDEELDPIKKNDEEDEFLPIPKRKSTQLEVTYLRTYLNEKFSDDFIEKPSYRVEISPILYNPDYLIDQEKSKFYVEKTVGQKKYPNPNLMDCGCDLMTTELAAALLAMWLKNIVEGKLEIDLEINDL